MSLSVLTFDTFKQRTEGDGEKLKWNGGSQRTEGSDQGSVVSNR